MEIDGPPGRTDGSAHASEGRSAQPQYYVTWSSRRRGEQFGWFPYSPPTWWPRNGLAQGALMTVVSLGVKARYAVAPPRDDDAARLAAGEVSTGDIAMNGPDTATPEDVPLEPALTLAWTPSFGGFSTVDGLVGRGFAAYVRILHPVETRRDGEAVTRVRWRDLPDARLDEPGWRPDRLPDGSVDFEYENTHGVEVSEGVIPDPERRIIHEILHAALVEAGDTSRVIQGIWVGIGGLDIEGATPCRIDQPGRDIVPFTGPFDEIVLIDDWHSAAIVYPESGAWCLANDTDLVSTYLGCSPELAQRFLDDPRLECVRVRPGDQLG